MPEGKSRQPNFSALWERFRSRENPISIDSKFYDMGAEGFTEKNHFHDFPQLWYCIDGSYTHTVGDNTYECAPGSFIIVPSGFSHSFDIAPHSVCKLVQTNILFNFFDNFDDDDETVAAAHIFLVNFAREIKFTPQIHTMFEGEEKELADSIFTKLLAINWSKHVSNFQAHKKLFIEIFSHSAFGLSQKHLSRARKFIDKKYIPLLRTVYYMNLNYSNKIYKEELIELSGICQTDYFRYIKRLLGCSFSIYLQRIRVRHAIVLSTFSPYSLSYIADICGFGDPTYMANRIKKFSVEARRLPSDMRKERKMYIDIHPFMIMTRDDYEKLTPFFNSYGL